MTRWRPARFQYKLLGESCGYLQKHVYVVAKTKKERVYRDLIFCFVLLVTFCFRRKLQWCVFVFWNRCWGFFLKDFVEYPPTLLVRSRAFSGVSYTLFAVVLPMIEEKHYFFVLSKGPFSICRHHCKLQAPRSIQTDVLDRYNECLSDVRYSTVSCSSPLRLCFSEEVSLEHNFELSYMDLIIFIPARTRSSHLVSWNEGRSRVATFVRLYRPFGVCKDPCLCFKELLFLVHVFFFAVMATQKEPVDFHYQTRSHYIRGMIQKMDGDVWLAETKVYFYLTH